MKTKYLLFSIVLLSVLTSCKKETETKIEEPKKSNNFKVTLDMLIKNDDSLQLFYQDELIPKFDEKNSLWVPVKGSLNSQEVTFNLPEEIIPTSLRIDISKKEGQQPIKINNFTVSYLDKKFETKDSTMIYYFSANNHLKYDPVNKTLTAIPVKGESYDPYIYTTDKLKAQVKNLLK